MVTPLSTNGQRGDTNAITVDGNRVLVYSPGGFADTPSLSGVGIHYEGNREPDGWKIKAIAPPASLFPYVGFPSAIDFTEDLNRTLWVPTVLADEGTKRLTPILRQPDGSFEAVGPGVDNNSYDPPVVGTSADLSQVVSTSRERPTLTDGTVDTRATSRLSLMLSERAPDGSIEIRQIAYRAGATMFPTCEVRLGGAIASGSTSVQNAVSSDGTKVFFTPVGLTSCTPAASQRVWAKVGSVDPIDLAASKCTVTCGTAQRAAFAGASSDGTRVYFTTEQKLLDGDQDSTQKNDLYEYDFNAPAGSELRLVTASAAAAGAGVLNVVRVSADGSRVYFVANGRPLAAANARGVTPQAGDPNLYVFHRPIAASAGSIDFVARLANPDAGLWGNSTGGRLVQMSTDGRFALFGSQGDLTGDRLPGDSLVDLFRYDAETTELRRVWSPDPAHNGAQRSSGAVMEGWSPVGGAALQLTKRSSPNMTADGGLVGFQTAQPLSPDDINDQPDAYLWDVESGQFTLLTSGQASSVSEFNSITPDASTILVTTSWPLLPQHRSGARATFALRRGGGFPADLQPLPPCVGDVCQGSLGDTGILAPPAATQAFGGPGNAVTSEPLLSQPKAVRVTRVRTDSSGVARLTVRAPSKGTVRVSGTGLRRTTRSAAAARTYTVPVRLTASAKSRLIRSGRLKLRATVRFTPEGGKATTARVNLTFTARSKSRSSVLSGPKSGGWSSRVQKER